MRSLALCIVLVQFTSLNAADSLPPLNKETAGKISYRRDVWPILKRHCWGCHSNAVPKGGLILDTFPDLRKGGDAGPLVQPGRPDESLLVKMIIGERPKMPRKQPPLSMSKVQVLRHWILAGANDDGKAVEDPQKALIPKTYRFAPAVTSVTINKEGNLIAAACRSEVVLLTAQGKVLHRLPTESGLLSHVELSPDGKLLAAVGGTPGRFGEVRFFDPATGKLISSRRVGHDTLFRGNFAPDGKSIAVGGADGNIHVIPVDGKAPVRSFDLHSDWVFDVAYSPDGKMLVSGGRDKATKVTSVETGKLLRSVDSSAEMIHAVASDPAVAISGGKARTLISYDYKIALQGIQVTGAGNGARPINKRNQYAKNFESQPGVIYDIAMSGDSKRMAVAGSWGDVRIYEVASRKRLAIVSKLPAPIYGIALNGDGSRLVIGSRQGLVQTYDIPDGKLISSVTPVPVATSEVGKK